MSGVKSVSRYEETPAGGGSFARHNLANCVRWTTCCAISTNLSSGCLCQDLRWSLITNRTTYYAVDEREKIFSHYSLASHFLNVYQIVNFTLPAAVCLFYQGFSGRGWTHFLRWRKVCWTFWIQTGHWKQNHKLNMLNIYRSWTVYFIQRLWQIVIVIVTY